jgi:hypothetical protein
MRFNIISFIIASCFCSGLFAQSVPDSSMFKPESGGLYPKKYEQGLSNISVSGYYRFLGTYSKMDTQYPEMGLINNRVFLGDDSNLPQLSLTLGVSPSKNTSVSTDFYLWTPLTGSENDYVKGLLLGVNLYGSHSTNYGVFSVKTGGIHWHKLSPLTFASNTGYNRYSLFERNPWDPNTKNVFDRYNTFYENGALTQDVRWGQQAFHGFIFEGADLPHDLSFSFMNGKSQLNGGTSELPNSLTGGRIHKKINNHFVSINGVRSQTFSDISSQELIGFNLITTEFEFKHQDKLTLYGEIGTGNYFAPNYAEKWGEAIDVRLQFSESITHFPLEIRYFRISPDVINNNGVFWNTSINEYSQNNEIVDPGQAPLLFPFASSLTSIGQMTNNRQGIILNTDMKFGNNKLTVGYSAAKEIVGVSDRITYSHPANSLALSRFWRWGFPPNVGPYGNINKVYRSVYETMLITDSISAKGFNSLEISFKTHTKLFNRPLMFYYLGGFHSVQRNFKAFPTYTDEAYLQSFNHQFDLYYALSKNITLCNYLGYDIIKGGQNTETDIDSNAPKDQKGISYAIGLDIQLAQNTGFYIRHRWMKYQDYSFLLDAYQGTETTVELKIFF